MNDDIYKMTLHSVCTKWIDDDYVTIIRVPGGWLYYIKKQVVFVPYCMEFINKSEE